MLDPEAERLLDKIAERGVRPYHELGIEASRAQIATLPEPGHDAAVASVEDRVIDGPSGPLTIRIYQPESRACPALVLYLHGGGWVMGSLDSHDKSCRRLAAGAGCTVVAVDYRLAPEHPFPAAFEDGQAALTWATAHGESLGASSAAIVVAGDSAGGNIAAALALNARERGPALALQLLIYPALEIGTDGESMARNAHGNGLDRESMQWFYNHYCPPEQRSDPRASPLLAPDLTGAAPAHIIVAGHDPLYDDGVAYARRLAEAGVRTTLSIYPGQIHGFYAMTRFLAGGREAQGEVIDAISRATRPDHRWAGDQFGPER